MSVDVSSESPDERRDRAVRMYSALRETYPDARCELSFDGPFQLLVATVLSAQSTDKGVNKVTPVLFGRFPDPAALAGAERAEVEEIIRPTGFFRNKAASIQGLAAALVADFDGQVPARQDALVTLPGVGRKTANVVLGHAFGIPGVTADTHVMRVSRRMGWTANKTPETVEADLDALFDQAEWTRLSDTVIFHGRRRCHAGKPACGACPVAAWCPSFGAGPTDPDAAAALVKGA
ncbi:MAG: endonuclease III [Propionibacteriaceae bacterium]|nr:endonuclease III [Propionibacteriaceae bacterium]